VDGGDGEQPIGFSRRQSAYDFASNSTGFRVVLAAGIPPKNEYHDRAEDLYNHAVATPGNVTYLDQLTADATSPAPWVRFYAVNYLGLLGQDKTPTEGQKQQTIEVLNRALGDTEHAVKRDAAKSIVEIGRDAARGALPELVKLVEAQQENDFNWYAAMALAQLHNKEDAVKVVAVLLRTACQPKPPSPRSGTLDLRFWAAASLIDLVDNNGLAAHAELVQLSAHWPPSELIHPELAELLDSLLRRTAAEPSGPLPLSQR